MHGAGLKLQPSSGLKGRLHLQLGLLTVFLEAAIEWSDIYRATNRENTPTPGYLFNDIAPRLKVREPRCLQANIEEYRTAIRLCDW